MATRKPTKYRYLLVLQGKGAGSPGWEDLDEQEKGSKVPVGVLDRTIPTLRYLRQQQKEWRLAWPGASLRIVNRRQLRES